MPMAIRNKVDNFFSELKRHDFGKTLTVRSIPVSMKP